MNRYFYIDSEGKQKGTFSPEELKNENIKRDTLVWTQGMSEWMRASDISELNALFIESAGYYPPQQPAQSIVLHSQQSASSSENLDNANAPIMSVKEWLITYLIMIIPVVNIVFLFIWAFGNNGENPNKVSWAKASLIWTAIVVGLYVVVFLIIIFAFIGSMSELGDVLGDSGYEI